MTKHLTYDNRLEIESYLKSNYSLSAISRNLGRHKSTLSNEILLRSAFEKKVATAVTTMHANLDTAVI